MEQIEATPKASDEPPQCPYLPGDMTSCLLAAIQELNGAS